MPNSRGEERISRIVSHLDQSCFSGRSSACSPAGPCLTTPATWSTPRQGACSVPQNNPTPAPDSPARRQAAEVKMAGYITIAHDTAQRLSEKLRHTFLYVTSPVFGTSLLCAGVERLSAGEQHDRELPKARAAQGPGTNNRHQSNERSPLDKVTNRYSHLRGGGCPRHRPCGVVDVLDIALVRTFTIRRRIIRARRPNEALLSRH